MARPRSVAYIHFRFGELERNTLRSFSGEGAGASRQSTGAGESPAPRRILGPGSLGRAETHELCTLFSVGLCALSPWASTFLRGSRNAVRLRWPRFVSASGGRMTARLRWLPMATTHGGGPSLDCARMLNLPNNWASCRAGLA